MKGFHRGGAGEDTKSHVTTLGLDFPVGADSCVRSGGVDAYAGEPPP